MSTAQPATAIRLATQTEQTLSTPPISHSQTGLWTTATTAFPSKQTRQTW